MIEFTKSYKTADAQVFGSIEDAQVHEISAILGISSDISKNIVSNKDKVMDILTTTSNSKPKARTIHGGTKKRNPKTIITDATTSVASTTNALPDGTDS